MTRRETADYSRPMPEYGDLMTVEEYLAQVESGSFIDDDGNGRAVKDGMVEDWTGNFGENDILPSEGDSKIPLDATHVVWFNS